MRQALAPHDPKFDYRQVTIAAATPADQPGVRLLHALATAEYAEALNPRQFGTYLEEELIDLPDHAEQGGELLVARRAMMVVGTVVYYKAGWRQRAGWPRGWATMRGLAVAAPERNFGVGRLLVQECLRRARRDGAGVLAAHVARFMRPAIRLGRNLGFRPEPRLDRGLPHGPDIVAYLRDLP